MEPVSKTILAADDEPIPQVLKPSPEPVSKPILAAG
jgi:hypothetical protein